MVEQRDKRKMYMNGPSLWNVKGQNKEKNIILQTTELNNFPPVPLILYIMSSATGYFSPNLGQAYLKTPFVPHATKLLNSSFRERRGKWSNSGMH